MSDDGQVIGDPTEAALVVLAAKLGADAELTRGKYPRLAEVPFDSAYKYMATFQRYDDGSGEVLVELVKGAPDVVLDLSTRRSGTARRSRSRPPARTPRRQPVPVGERPAGARPRHPATPSATCPPVQADPGARWAS